MSPTSLDPRAIAAQLTNSRRWNPSDTHAHATLRQDLAVARIFHQAKKILSDGTVLDREHLDRLMAVLQGGEAR